MSNKQPTKRPPGMDLSGSFLALLCRWHGSLYKLLYKELLCFLVAFASLSIVYRHALDESQKSLFEQVVRYCDKYLNMIPLSFILGFYVTIVASRWWNQCLSLPWPDRLMLAIAMYIPGNDAESRLLRKTLCQNCNLMAVLVFRTISESVRDVLQTLEDVVHAGFMTKAEMESFKAAKADVNLYWLPGLWFAHHLRDAQKEGRITDAHGARLIMAELLDFRSKCGVLWNYDWVSIPLVYTQVVTLATYSFFIASVLGRQHIPHDNPNKEVLPADAYFPSWTLLQLLFYMGLLKVAEHMINPMGDDEEDFDLNWLLNRHRKVIQLGTDGLCDQSPPITEDTVNPEAFNATKSRRKSSSRERKNSQTFTALYSPKCPRSFAPNISMHVEMHEAPADDGETCRPSNEHITSSTAELTGDDDDKWTSGSWRASPI